MRIPQTLDSASKVYLIRNKEESRECRKKLSGYLPPEISCFFLFGPSAELSALALVTWCAYRVPGFDFDQDLLSVFPGDDIWLQHRESSRVIVLMYVVGLDMESCPFVCHGQFFDDFLVDSTLLRVSYKTQSLETWICRFDNAVSPPFLGSQIFQGGKRIMAAQHLDPPSFPIRKHPSF